MSVQKLADDGTPRPVLRVIRGDATPEEIAVILAIVGASGGGGEEAEPEPVSIWTASRSHRVTQVAARAASPGRDGWRTSYWPR